MMRGESALDRSIYPLTENANPAHRERAPGGEEPKPLRNARVSRFGTTDRQCKRGPTFLAGFSFPSPLYPRLRRRSQRGIFSVVEDTAL